MKFAGLFIALMMILGGTQVMADVNPRDFGAVGDGVTDDTVAMQAALDAAVTQGPICAVPAGKYRLNGSLVVPAGVTLKGASGGVPHSEHPIGTVLLAYGGRDEVDGTPLITLKPNAVIRECIIHYPEQKLPDIVPYPWTIRIDGELCQVTDVTMTNPYNAIDCGTLWNELHTIRNVFACPLKTGIYIDQCSDIGRIENVHFNPNFWARMALEPKFDGDIKAWLEKNLVGFKIGRTDWEYITNCFVIFPLIGYHFDDFGHGPGNAIITQSGSDICPVSIRVDQTQGHSGVQFVNAQIMSTVEIGEKNNGPVKMTNCGFWTVPETKSQIIKRGPSTLMLTSCHFSGWDSANEGAACVSASGGRIMLNGCDFMSGKLALQFEEGLQAAIISNCMFRDEAFLVNNSGAQVEVSQITTR